MKFDTSDMKYEEIPEGLLEQKKLFKYSIWENFYFEKKDKHVYIYYRKSRKEKFELCLIENKFVRIEKLLEEKTVCNEIDTEWERNLPFDTGYSSNNKLCEPGFQSSEELEKQIRELENRIKGSQGTSPVKKLPRCYILIQYQNDQACIKEIISKKIIVRSFDINSYKLYRNYFYNSDDRIIRFLEEKTISLLSLKNGYIFGPYRYNSIEEYELGAIVDGKYAIEYYGGVKDLHDYERIKGKYNYGKKRHDVFYNRRCNSCYIIIDGPCLLEEMEPIVSESDNKSCDEEFELNLGMIEFTFHPKEKKLEIEEFYNKDEWTDEDAWDAMTDGQYGDYPGSGWDSERFGY